METVASLGLWLWRRIAIGEVTMPGNSGQLYAPYHSNPASSEGAPTAELPRRPDRLDDAAIAYEKALELTSNAIERDHFRPRLEQVAPR